MIKEYIDQIGTTITAFALKAGMSRQTLHTIIREGKATEKRALQLEKASNGVLNHKLLMVRQDD